MNRQKAMTCRVRYIFSLPQSKQYCHVPDFPVLCSRVCNWINCYLENKCLAKIKKKKKIGHKREVKGNISGEIQLRVKCWAKLQTSLKP